MQPNPPAGPNGFNIMDINMASNLTMTEFLTYIGFSLLIGLMLALMYMYKTRYTKSFVVTLATLPAVVAVVIVMVNGSIGAGIAVAGAFSLVRFRSAAGSAKEICTLFLAMGAGLIIGMGYLTHAFLFAFILGLVGMIYTHVDFGYTKNMERYKTLRVVIPEDLDYTEIYDDLFAEYTTAHDLTQVKTTNMGSMFRLTYNVTLKKDANEKEMIDKMRCRNGNLEITISKQNTSSNEL